MSGAESLGGFVYQQRYVTYRVLAALGLCALKGESGPRLKTFSIEGRTGSDAPIWDVRFEFTDGFIDLHECKDTRIDRPDRLKFYNWLRKEVAIGTRAERIRSVWVTNPDKQTPNALEYLGGIAQAVSALNLADVKGTLPARMGSIQDAVQEAVYQLCHHSGGEDLPRPCTFEEAKALLANLRIASHQFDQLSESVKLLVTGVLTKGTPDAVQKFVTGVLTEEVVTRGEAQFAVDDFLQAIGTTALQLEVEGRIRHLLSFDAATGVRPAIRLVRWTQLDDKPTTRWTLGERAPGYLVGHGALVVGTMGVGKTVASQMAFEEEAARLNPSHVVRVEAKTLDQDDFDAVLRLACMLCGVGETWLAIDGMDEIPHELRTCWERTIGPLIAIPHLTLFVTVRREVLVVREWLAILTATLPRVEMQLLTPEQVERAFADVHLPVPTNKRLIQALRNPFLLSLYADVVTPTDMPLAESGEASAFRVIKEFWNRRVRGVSIGQRAVGDSETSQEPKRQAALYLADRALAGDLAVDRNSANPQVIAGIEMLLREGVIREQGTAAAAWLHDWLREYAMVDRLLSRCDTPTAVALARRITADCKIDHVARSAAVGAVKWVLSNPSVGSSADFVKELWEASPGLAREALMVLLEGPDTDLSLQTLPDDVLAETVTLASHLGATQWGEQISRLEDARFFANGGDQLHAITVDFELKTLPAGGKPTTQTVCRLVDRDLRRCQAGRWPLRRTFRAILDAVLLNELFHETVVVDWLRHTARVANGYDFGELLKAVSAMIAVGAVDSAHAVFRSIAGCFDPIRRDAIAEALVERKFLFGQEFTNVLCHSSLLSGNHTPWGITAIEVLAALVIAKQRKGWPSRMRFWAAIAKHSGEPFQPDRPFEPDYDEEPRFTSLDDDEEKPIVRVARAVRQAFADLALRDAPDSFRQLADSAMQARFAAVVVLPLLAIRDAFNAASPRDWHAREAVRLLSHEGISELETLEDVRRLIRRQLLAVLDGTGKETVIAAIRRANVPADARVRELSDLQTWGVLSTQEAREVDEAVLAGKIADYLASGSSRIS